MSAKANKRIATLVEALLSLKTTDEAERFIRDLLTEAEITEFSNRFCAAQMLSEKVSYAEIVKETGLSSTTVARVSKWLNKGGNGYKEIIARMHHSHPTTPMRRGLSLRKK